MEICLLGTRFPNKKLFPPLFDPSTLCQPLPLCPLPVCPLCLALSYFVKPCKAVMAMATSEPYRIVGGDGSPYSCKLRAVFRYRRLPFLWTPQYLLGEFAKGTLFRERFPKIKVVRTTPCFLICAAVFAWGGGGGLLGRGLLYRVILHRVTSEPDEERGVSNGPCRLQCSDTIEIPCVPVNHKPRLQSFQYWCVQIIRMPMTPHPSSWSWTRSLPSGVLCLPIKGR